MKINSKLKQKQIKYMQLSKKTKKLLKKKKKIIFRFFFGNISCNLFSKKCWTG